MNHPRYSQTQSESGIRMLIEFINTAFQNSLIHEGL
jgi:hypothetical protein